MAEYDTIIFDMDGTTLDTLQDLADSMNFTLNTFGFPARTLEEVRSFVGNGAARFMELSLPGGSDNPQFENCLAAFKKRYAENLQNKTAPFAGIPELLEKLHKENYKLAIVSNKFDQAVKALNRKYFGKYITVAIGETEAIKKKPAPDSVFQALEELHTCAKKAIYVGDSEVDVKTARNSGLISVGVTWGFGSRKILEEEGADFIIDRPDELLNILELV